MPYHTIPTAHPAARAIRKKTRSRNWMDMGKKSDWHARHEACPPKKSRAQRVALHLSKLVIDHMRHRSTHKRVTCGPQPPPSTFTTITAFKSIISPPKSIIFPRSNKRHQHTPSPQPCTSIKNHTQHTHATPPCKTRCIAAACQLRGLPVPLCNPLCSWLRATAFLQLPTNATTYNPPLAAARTGRSKRSPNHQ